MCILSRDDHQLLQWNLLNAETNKIADFPNDLFPIDLHWLPKTASQKNKVAADVFLLTAADGRFSIKIYIVFIIYF